VTTHDRDLELLAAGAFLDDLDPVELARFEDHQAGCVRCSELTADLRDTIGDLALMSAPRRPPESLAASIMTAVAGSVAEPALAFASPGPAVARRVADRPPAEAPTSWSARLGAILGGRRIGLAPVAAGLLLATVSLGAWGVSTRVELDRVAAVAADARSVAGSEAAAMAVAVAPDHATVTLTAEPLAPAAHAVLLYRPGHPEAYLVASDLPATPAGKVYQLWVADADGVHGLATYRFGGSGQFIAPIDRDLTSSSAVMITLEPEGGATGEPGPQVVFGTL
jgi:hypothetical protein